MLNNPISQERSWFGLMFKVNTPYLMSKLLTLGRFEPHASYYVTKCLPCKAAVCVCVCEQESIFHRKKSTAALMAFPDRKHVFTCPD